MLTSLTMGTFCHLTVRDLLHFQMEGCPIIRYSHAGNTSLHKLLLSELGIWDCVWEATCVHKDLTQPRDKFLRGKRFQLLNHQLPQQKGVEYLVPYQRCEDGMTLSSVHVHPLRRLFGKEVVITNAEMLLKFKEKVEVVFGVVQKYKPALFGRYVLPCGCMVELIQRGNNRYLARCAHDEVFVDQSAFAESAFHLLEELYRLVWNPIGCVPKGGVLFSFELAIVFFILTCYWYFGDRKIFMLLEPDVIHYSTQKPFVKRVRDIMFFLSQNLPNLVPEKVEVCVVPATTFCFGHLKRCSISKGVMYAHKAIWDLELERRQKIREGVSTECLDAMLVSHVKFLKEHASEWDIFYDPACDVFFSQHDLESSGVKLKVMEEYLDVPFSELEKMMGTLQQTERTLTRLLCFEN